MSRTCRRLRPFLFRVAEGEASPEEALLAARHLPGCTACRILLHRERNLAEVLETLGDPVGVGDGFLSAVMGAIPAGAPPRRDRADARRKLGLKIVGGGGAAALLLSLVSWQGVPGHARATSLSVVLPDLESGDRFLEGLSGLAQLVAAALVQAGGSLVPSLPSLPRPAVAAFAAGPAAAGLGLACAMLLWMVTRHALGRVGRPAGQASPSSANFASRAEADSPSARAAAERSPFVAASARRT